MLNTEDVEFWKSYAYCESIRSKLAIFIYILKWKSLILCVNQSEDVDMLTLEAA